MGVMLISVKIFMENPNSFIPVSYTHLIWEQKDWKRARTWYRLHAPAETDGRQPLAHRADGRAGEVRGDLPETLFLKVLEKKSAWKVTTESLFFAAAASVLYALSPQETIRMGRVLGNRRYSQLGRLGMYVNLQPVMVLSLIHISRSFSCGFPRASFSDWTFSGDDPSENQKSTPGNGSGRKGGQLSLIHI